MKSKLYLFLILLTVMTGSLVNVAKAQDTVVTKIDHGKLDSINSGILKQKRLIQVFTPANYKPGSTDKYDVLYVLDGGNWNTGLILQLQHFLEGEPYMPPIIIVSVLNIDRNKDLTPTHSSENNTSGGADKFLGFLKNELIPYVDKTYPSNGNNTLWGHSFGGLFVLYALLNEPKTFKSYIAVDPSLWWDKVYLPKIAANKLPALAGLNTILFIGGRAGDDGKGMKIDTMDTILKKLAPAGLTWKTEMYPDETHGSVRLKTTHDGLKFIYMGYGAKGPTIHPTNGILLKNKPIKMWLFGDSSKVRYTTDGTEPTLASAQIKKEFTLSAPGKLIAKRFSNNGRYDMSSVGEFKEGTYLPALSKVKNGIPGGFNYAYYEGKWDKVPDFSQLKSVKSGLTDTAFKFNKLPGKNNFALLIEGWLQVKEDGYYLFGLASDDGSKLYINNRLLIDHDGLHSNNSAKSYVLPLKRGFYPIRVEYFQKDGDYDLQLLYLTPGISDIKKITPIPFELQYHQ
jgi:predicted alpha/beta superfamily hydrolase